MTPLSVVLLAAAYAALGVLLVVWISLTCREWPRWWQWPVFIVLWPILLLVWIGELCSAGTRRIRERS